MLVFATHSPQLNAGSWKHTMHEPIQILIISSELGNQRALVDILHREYWDSICASTVNECQEVLARRNISLVFCDRQLPDGIYRDVLRMIRSLNIDLPLVVTSRLADWNEYFEALQDGAIDVIASPCQPTDAIWVTRRALARRQKRATSIQRVKACTGMSSQDAIRRQDDDVAKMATRDQKQALP
jgi:DNA-binding NtrC family response regulator